MSLKFCAMIIGLFSLFAGGNLAMAQQDANNQAQPMMTPVSTTVIEGDSRKSLVEQLHLKAYEVAAGDMSLCGNDKVCLKLTKNTKSWLCAAALCNGTDNSKSPITCIEKASQKYSIKVQEQLDAVICSLVKSPSASTRRAVLIEDPSGISEDGLVTNGAFLMALKGSAGSCENYIKDYVGPYGPQWKSKWYEAMSGCRIIAHERTRKQEEKDFYAWFGVVLGMGNCSDISNIEMRKACQAPGATSPVPVLW